MSEKFSGNFTQQMPISDDAISAAIAVLRHGRLHRYNLAQGEVGEAASLEAEFAEFVGAKYCLAVASGGFAMATAMRAAGVSAGDKVLSNVYTLAPVPGAIAAVGAEPILVEVTEALTIDLVDLERKIGASGAEVLLLSHMRGHICDMARLVQICVRHRVQVIEDCAHTMGATWGGVASGRHGLVGCYSTQTYKHLNSGEGGLIVSDDAELMARATILSGSYMHFGRHGAGPPTADFDAAKYQMPNTSGRVDNLRAAILRPQLRGLAEKIVAWNARYRVVEAGLSRAEGVQIIERDAQEGFVGSSIQFLVPGANAEQIRAIVRECAERGVDLKWFGDSEPVGFTSKYDSWRYADLPAMAQSDAVLAGLLDMRLPLGFSLDDCALITRIICDQVANVLRA